MVVVAVVVAVVAATAPVGMEHLDVGRMLVNASC
jgi:hypothetical protein